MKIAFVGKGGSGKTTLSSLFSRYLAVHQSLVVAIDADINQHLAVSLGMTPSEAVALPALGLQMHRVKSYLRGTNPRIHSNASMTKTTPPGGGSNLLDLRRPNPITDYFARTVHGVSLMATGPFSEDDLGVACYHSKVGAVELILSHLVDRSHEYVIVDMTAGADSFASGMFTKFDLTVLVAEPTLKGIGVYHQYRQYARDYDIKLVVVGNKVESQEDIDFLREHVGDDLIASFGRSSFVHAREKGRYLPFHELESENMATLARLRDVIDATPQNFPRLYRYTVEFHERNALSWANEEVGEDLRLQIDPSFMLANPG